MALAPNQGLAATPITPATLQFGEYDESGMQGYYEEVGAQSKDVDSWIAMVSENLGVQRAAWETDADYQIQMQLDAVNQTDAYNGIENYRDYLLKALDSQKEQAWETWERAATTDIYLQLNNYVETYATGVYRDSESNNESNQTNADAALQNNRLTSSQIREQFERSRDKWENQFSDSVEDGLKGYGKSLETINDDYARFQDSLDQADTKFQENLQAIQDYKTNVINGINTTVGNLKDFLNNGANTTLFGASGGRTDAGRELETLIGQFETTINGLGTNNFSLVLTQLSSYMTTYLQTQTSQATATQQGHAVKVNVMHMNNTPITPISDPNTNMLDETGITSATHGPYITVTTVATEMPGISTVNNVINPGFRQVKDWRDSGSNAGNVGGDSAATTLLKDFVKNKFYSGNLNLSVTYIHDANIS